MGFFGKLFGGNGKGSPTRGGRILRQLAFALTKGNFGTNANGDEGTFGTWGVQNQG